MHLRAPKPTSTARRQSSSSRTSHHLHARFPHVLEHSISASSSPAYRQAEHGHPDGQAGLKEEDDSSHIAGKWGQLAEVLFPEMLELDGDGEEEPPEGDEDANAIPADVAAHLRRILSSASSELEDPLQPAFPSTSYCINCCSPFTSKPSSSGICLECGWSNDRGQDRKAAASPLLSPYATLQWSALLQAQQRHQPVRQGLHQGVALGFDERMLLHRASLPPYPERPERLTAILTRLLEQGLLPLCMLQRAREATLEELHAVHSPDLVQGLAAAAATIGAAQEMCAHSHAGHSSNTNSSSSGSSAPSGVDAGLLARSAAAATLAAAALTAAREGLSSHAAHAPHAAQPSAHEDGSSRSGSAIDHSTPSIPSAGASAARSGTPAVVTAMGDAIDTQSSAPHTANSTLDAACASTAAGESDAAAGPPSVASHRSPCACTTSTSHKPSSATTTLDTHPATPSLGVHGSELGVLEVQGKEAESVADAPAASSLSTHSSSSGAEEVKGEEAEPDVQGRVAGEASLRHMESRSSAEVPFYGGTLAPDTLVSAHTFQAASLAAGCSAQLARSVAQGEVGSAFALVRPHGHHADHCTAQSGCYFNNAAVAARAGQDAGARRVLIVDWDVHHGQGTEAIFAEDNTVMVVSLHRADEEFYPGTGLVTDVGVRDGRGYTLNIPFQDNLVTDGDYLQCMLHVVLPVAHQFQPDMVVVSAGFDAAEGDFFGQTCISPACYAHMTHMLLGLAPCLFVLEGGYNLDATARCVGACLRVMLGARPPRLEEEYQGTKRMSKAGLGACMNAMQVQGEFWPSLASLNLNGWMAVIHEHQEAASSEDEGTELETEDEEWN